MPKNLTNCNILLIGGSISFIARKEDKYIRLENLDVQEAQYVQFICDKLLSLQPKVILVEKNVMADVRDKLQNAGVVLIVNVKIRVLKRLSNLLNVNIFNDVAMNTTEPEIGKCPKYSINYFTLANGSIKSLIYISGDSMRKGGSMILRGGNFSELVRVKRILKRILLIEYHGRLERRFLQEIHANAELLDTNFTLTNMTLSPFVQLELKGHLEPVVDYEEDDEDATEVSIEDEIDENRFLWKSCKRIDNAEER